MKTKRSYDLPPESVRPRKTKGIINPSLKAWEARRNCWCNSSPRAEDEIRSINKAGKKGQISPSFIFCSINTLQELDDIRSHWRQSTESTNSNADLIWKHLHRHTQKQCLIRAPCGQSNWHIKLTVTPCNGVFPNSKEIQCFIIWWVPSENHNSKPGGVLWKTSGDLDKTFFCWDLVQVSTQLMGTKLKVLIRLDWSEFKLI